MSSSRSFGAAAASQTTRACSFPSCFFLLSSRLSSQLYSDVSLCKPTAHINADPCDYRMDNLPKLLADADPTFLATFSGFYVASQTTLKVSDSLTYSRRFPPTSFLQTWRAVRDLPPPLVSARTGPLAAKPRLRLALLAVIVMVLGTAEVSFLLEWLPVSLLHPSQRRSARSDSQFNPLAAKLRRRLRLLVPRWLLRGAVFG